MPSQSPPAVRKLIERTPPTLSVLAEDVAFIAGLPANRLKALRAAPEEGSRWHLAMAIAHLRLGDANATLEHSRDAARLSTTDGDLVAMRDARAVQTLGCVFAGRYGAAEELLEIVHGLEIDANPRLRVYEEIAGWYALRSGTLLSGHYPQALEHFRRATDHYRTVGQVDQLISGLDGLANAQSALGEYLDALSTVDQALEVAERIGRWADVHRLLVGRATALSDMGYHDEAAKAFDVAVDWCELVGDGFNLAFVLRAYADLVGGRTRYGRQDAIPRATALLDRSIATAEKGGCMPAVVEGRRGLARLYASVGQTEEAANQHRLAHAAIESAVPIGLSKILAMREIERQAVEENRISRLAERMQATAESSPDAVMVFEPTTLSEGRAQDFCNEFRNSAAERLLECGKTGYFMLSGLVDRPFLRDMQTIVRRVIEHSSPYEDEIEAVGHWYVRRVVPSGDGVAVCIRDVTERHHAEGDLRDAVRKAQVADRAKSEFLANMSHEVRTPINGVLGLAGLLADTPLSATQRSYVDGIIAGTDLLLGVVGDVLDLAKIESGRLQLEPEELDIRTLVRDLCSVFLGQATKRGIRLSSRVDELVPRTIVADPTRLRQVLANLLGNAVKFTPKGSIDLSVAASADRLIFTVRDTGIGIAADKLGSIFQAFEQAHPVIEVQGGSGLGLAITQRLVTLMKGEVGVESVVGTGSVFWVSLPLQTTLDAQIRREREGRNPGASYGGHRVLLAEDNATNALVAKALLERMGVEVEVATDGLAAVAAAVRGEFSAILMDVRMPSLDGLEATRRIRQNEARSGHRTAIVAVTAGALSEEREECFAAGMDDFLGKPFREAALRKVLDTWIGTANRSAG